MVLGYSGSFPMILSILSQAYTLPPRLRDDLGVLQRHPYQFQRFTDPSSLVKRQISVATLYWGQNGNIKAAFNVDINYGPESNLLIRAAFVAQLGTHWRVIVPRPYGVVTIGILTLDARFRFMRYVHMYRGKNPRR